MGTTVIPSVSPRTISDSIGILSPDIVSYFTRVRTFTEKLCEPLSTEDYVIQPMEEVSPTKWHLAHTSWFFETFVLKQYLKNYSPLNPQYTYLFNSYYNQAGLRHFRPKRGLISRPTVQDTYAYRRYIDEHITDLLTGADERLLSEIAPLIILGCNHEQQHQELILTDIKYVFAQNPLYPVYIPSDVKMNGDIPSLRWISYPEGTYRIGFTGGVFSYDNEGPSHRVFLEPYRLATRLITNREYIAFIEDGGYRRPELWLSLGWNAVEKNEWQAPLYWNRHDDAWWYFTLGGFREVDLDEPVCHVSYFEADAYARWADARLPYESEWEISAQDVPVEGNFVENERYHPVPLSGSAEYKDIPLQLYGDVWEWTQSHYSPYPGFKPVEGAIGEYNGKFMCNQFVLRGGSCATSKTHIRKTYRNFFDPHARWQFSGIRLAKTE
jgi:ergothioneine biosynthesis protein EgtB